MSLSATIRALVAAGATPEMILAVVEVHEATTADALAARRESDARRQKAKRERDDNTVSRDITLPVSGHVIPVPHVGERDAQVVIPFSSSLRSEEVTSEAKASSVNASKPADPIKPKTKPPKSERGTRLSPDWEPSVEEFDLARSEGLSDEEINRAATEFRNYWCSRSRDATRLSWKLTWHNRVIEIGDRKRRNGARMAASPSNASGGRRGASTFADIYARRHGFTEG